MSSLTDRVALLEGMLKERDVDVPAPNHVRIGYRVQDL
jgi:hypothetical protein